MRGLGLLVAAVVVALLLLPEVEVEVLVEVAIAFGGRRGGGRFHAVEAPPGANLAAVTSILS
jgi:hypothetical protein